MGNMMNAFGFFAIGVFALCAAMNDYIFVRHHLLRRQGERNVSMVLLVGGLFGVVGFLQFAPLRPYAWAPLLVDAGTILGVLGIAEIFKRTRSTSPHQLAREYVASVESKRKALSLRLYKSGKFVLEQKFNRTPVTPGIIHSSAEGEWSERDGILFLEGYSDTARLVPEADGQAGSLRVVKYFGCFEGDSELSIQGTVLKVRM